MKSADDIAAFIEGHGVGVKPLVAGKWHSLQIRPDPASGELLNIGVAFVDDSERVHLRLASDLSRLECLYDDRIDVASFERLSGLIQEAFNGAKFSDFRLAEFTPHALLTQGRYASGASINGILQRFYEDTVPLGRCRATDKVSRQPRARSITTETAQSKVINCLKQRMGNNVFRYLPDRYHVIKEANGAEHELRFPIRVPGQVAASIVSLWVKNDDRRQLRLTRAGLDLGMLNERSGGERLGLFVMRPSVGNGYSQSDVSDIDNEIDDAAWRLRRVANIEIDQGEDPEQLSERLQHWIEAA